MGTGKSNTQTIGGMTLTSRSTFVIAEEELKNFYLQFAYLSNPNSCSVNRTEFELLNILLKELRKNMEALSKFNAHKWDKGMMEIQTENMYYLTHENISPKERIRVNNCVSEHMTFLTQMVISSQNMRHLFEVYSRHYKNVSRLLSQYSQSPKEEDLVIE